jgi:hypothetical protein
MRKLATCMIHHYQKYCYKMCPIRIGSSLTVVKPYINSGLRLESSLINIQLISNGSSFEPLLIIPPSVAVLNQNHFGLNFKTISSGSS